jgi:hypothetical protein
MMAVSLTSGLATELMRDFDPAGQVASVTESRASVDGKAQSADLSLKSAKVTSPDSAVTMLAVAPKQKPYG